MFIKLCTIIGTSGPYYASFIQHVDKTACQSTLARKIKLHIRDSCLPCSCAKPACIQQSEWTSPVTTSETAVCLAHVLNWHVYSNQNPHHLLPINWCREVLYFSIYHFSQLCHFTVHIKENKSSQNCKYLCVYVYIKCTGQIKYFAKCMSFCCFLSLHHFRGKDHCLVVLQSPLMDSTYHSLNQQGIIWTSKLK